MYNLDAGGHPAPGAPFPKFFTNVFSELCTLCHSLLLNVDKFYWKNLHGEYERKRDSLSSDGTYFPGGQ